MFHNYSHQNRDWYFKQAAWSGAQAAAALGANKSLYSWAFGRRNPGLWSIPPAAGGEILIHRFASVDILFPDARP